MECIAHTLIHSRLDTTITITDFTNLSHFPNRVIANVESAKETFVEIVDYAEGGLVWCTPFRCMQVPYINLISFQALKRFLQCKTQVRGGKCKTTPFVKVNRDLALAFCDCDL